MGQLVAQSDALSLKERFAAYQALFLEALRIKTTPKKHTDVLMHMMGFFKKELSADEKQELLEIIDHYKQGLIPLDRAGNPSPALCAQIQSTLFEKPVVSGTSSPGTEIAESCIIRL